MKKDLYSKNLPAREGVYLVKNLFGSRNPQEIDVYEHPIKGLCCFLEDFGSQGTGVNDETDCHVSVQNTGLEFLSRVRGLNEHIM